jgi:Fe-S-cluster containining protein
MPRGPEWKTTDARRALLALYAEADALLAGFSCDASTDCCHFARTGREPYPTAVELAEIAYAVAAVGIATTTPARSKRALPLANDERRCPLLSSEGRCRIYASRPLGCRTFFCDRATGPGKLPRNELQRVARAIADLSARYAPRDPHARPMTSAIASLAKRG